MKTYLLICLIMMIFAYIKVYSAVSVVKKKYPNKIKPIGFLQKIVSIIKILIYFFTPLLNLIAFISIFFMIKTTDMEKMIEKRYVLGVDN